LNSSHTLHFPSSLPLAPIDSAVSTVLGEEFTALLVIDGNLTYLYITDPDANVLLTAIRIKDERMGTQMREVFYRYWEI